MAVDGGGGCMCRAIVSAACALVKPLQRLEGRFKEDRDVPIIIPTSRRRKGGCFPCYFISQREKIPRCATCGGRFDDSRRMKRLEWRVCFVFVAVFVSTHPVRREEERAEDNQVHNDCTLFFQLLNAHACIGWNERKERGP